MNFPKRPTNETLLAATAGMVHNDSIRSSMDIFFTANPEQAKDMIMNDVRQELYQRQSRAPSEAGPDDNSVNKIDFSDQSMMSKTLYIDQNARKSTMILAGPKFRSHTVDPEVQIVRDTIYPVSVNVYFSFTITN